MPALHWLTRDEDLRVASRVPYRLLGEASASAVGHSKVVGRLYFTVLRSMFLP